MDSGTPEVYENIKRVNHFNKVWENLARYAAAQKENIYKVKTKYIIYPGYNDTKEEFDKFMELTLQAGVNSMVLDVEGGWYENNRYNIPEYLYELLDYATNRCEEVGLKYVEHYDRANHMRIHRNDNKNLSENAEC